MENNTNSNRSRRDEVLRRVENANAAIQEAIPGASLFKGDGYKWGGDNIDIYLAFDISDVGDDELDDAIDSTISKAKAIMTEHGLGRLVESHDKDEDIDTGFGYNAEFVIGDPDAFPDAYSDDEFVPTAE